MDGYNIYLRQDGRWEGRISQGKKENGKRKFLYIFGKSREAVRNKIDELRKNSNRSTSKTVDELFGEWYKSICYRVGVNPCKLSYEGIEPYTSRIWAYSGIGYQFR